MTNREVFNNMTNREIAEYVKKNFIWICYLCELRFNCGCNPDEDCIDTIEKWLGEEAKNE